MKLQKNSSGQFDFRHKDVFLTSEQMLFISNT